MSVFLKEISIKGFRSLKCLNNFRPRQINLLIGPNGAGKSNFLSFFRMLSWMTKGEGNLREFIATYGQASRFLFGGHEKTPLFSADLRLETESGMNDYSFKLSHAAGDQLIFNEEKYRYSSNTIESIATWKDLGVGHMEPNLNRRWDDQTAKTIRALLNRMAVFQFHNTSKDARIRDAWNTDDNVFLKEDAGNIGAFLMRLSNDSPGHYARLLDALRQVIPFFSEFFFAESNRKTMLRWTEKWGDHVFDAAQASDGMLRILALWTLLLQPSETLPQIIFLDEPELGLHPRAVYLFSEIVKEVALNRQIFIATQSALLLNMFAPEDIVTVTRESDGSSQFRKLAPEELSGWLDDYSLSDLWQKGVLEGAFS